MMNYIAGLILLVASITAWAQTYMVFEYNANARIVLGQGSCLVQGLTGARASVQRNDGKFIRGCWQFIDNDAHVKIEWENPAKPGDFAILNAKDFHPVDE